MKNPYLQGLNNIHNVKDLITFVRTHGIDTSDIENINRISDIVNRSPICDVAEASKTDRTVFYFIIKYIWNIPDTIEFYNKYHNEEYKRLLGKDEECMRLAELTEMQEKQKACMAEDCASYIRKLQSEMVKCKALENALQESKQEILSLKARLYDLTEQNCRLLEKGLVNENEG